MEDKLTNESSNGYITFVNPNWGWDTATIKPAPYIVSNEDRTGVPVEKSDEGLLNLYEPPNDLGHLLNQTSDVHLDEVAKIGKPRRSKGIMAEISDAAKEQWEAIVREAEEKKLRNTLVCKTCGSDQVGKLEWKNVNTSKKMDIKDIPSDNYCAVCECKTELITKDKFNPNDEEEDDEPIL